MIPTGCIEIHTSPLARASVPSWFAEVVMITHHLARQGLLEAFTQQGRLVRGRFGSYEPIDFLGLLIGYAISGERRLSDFFERVAPFEMAFMALFGRRCLPHRSSLSRFLAAVDRPCLEAFRALFEQHSFAQGWTAESSGGIFDRQGRRFIVFDVDATRQAARQRALPCGADLPPAMRRFDAVCAPGYTGRKPVLLGPIRWVDMAGRALRRSWTTHWRRRYVEPLPLADTPPGLSPPLRPPRAVRSHHRWSWPDRLACNAWSGPPKLRITMAGVPACLASN